MLNTKKEKSFKNDEKMLFKKHYNFNEVSKIITLLENQMPLPNKYKDHYLQGNWKGFKECHIDSKILLIYQITDTVFRLVRIGNHNDLLNK
ncbi:MAG: type II toxin-antitoxin system mRNA interferase toxin, HP0892 family [Rickettsiales bacterium]|nr:MAG: type II toxin-antitoxin system mRNA interferase toxin, HP0892 family [Rickettsiales bacterium]